jgi:two-component system sensor histidine kinase UhpB
VNRPFQSRVSEPDGPPSADPPLSDRTTQRASGTVRFLRIPLFWKIVLANLALTVIVGAVGVGLALALGGADGGTLTAAAILIAVTVVLASVLLNAGLVRLALTPLGELEHTARSVARGDVDARTPVAAVADDAMQSLIAVFNNMLDSLSANRRRQRELARRVLESEERERQLIAHELYSGTAQTLAGVLVRLRMAERHLTSASNGSIREIREEVVQALEEVRGVARRLRPPELDELGVRVALEAHARSIGEGRRMDFQFEGEVPPLSRESSLALFRIVQEAISNAALHSGADNVRVIFSHQDANVITEVVDDGRGFDPEQTLSRAARSLGLFGMHERAGYVQGELSLESGLGRGTRVRVVIPTDPEAGWSVVNGTADRLVDGLVVERDLAAQTV